MSDTKNSKKQQFIINFLEALGDFGKGFIQAFAREPWHYKDLRLGGFDPDKIYHNLGNLRYRGILDGEGGNFKFTKKGIVWVQNSHKRYFKLRYKNWDNKWRVIIFDIPQELHRERIKLRKKLKSLGCHMLQKSVFIFPYPCEEELSNIATQLKVSDYVDIIIADNAGFNEVEIKKLFNL